MKTNHILTAATFFAVTFTTSCALKTESQRMEDRALATKLGIKQQVYHLAQPYDAPRSTSIFLDKTDMRLQAERQNRGVDMKPEEIRRERVNPLD